MEEQKEEVMVITEGQGEQSKKEKCADSSKVREEEGDSDRDKEKEVELSEVRQGEMSRDKKMNFISSSLKSKRGGRAREREGKQGKEKKGEESSKEGVGGEQPPRLNNRWRSLLRKENSLSQKKRVKGLRNQVLRRRDMKKV